MKKFLLPLTEEMHLKLKKLALDKGISLKALLTKAIEEKYSAELKKY